MRLIDFFDRGVAMAPARTCLKDDISSSTFVQVQERSYRIAQALRRDGLKAGDKVTVYSKNCAVAFECILGILRAGCVWVPLNSKNAVAENNYILGNCDVEFVFYHSEFSSEVSGLVGDAAVKGTVCMDQPAANAAFIDNWLSGVAALDPDVERAPSDIATISSTGGRESG